MAHRIPAHRQAQTEIKRYIAAKGLGIGDPLPPEAVLAEQLGISRPSLREAVKALESLGIVEARHGEGIFVSAFSFDAILENLPYSIVADGRSAAELLQVRATLELGVICQVADALSPDELRQLRALAQRMLDAARAGLSFEAEGKAFHALLFQSLGNGLLLRLVDLFWEVFRRLNEAHGFNPDEWSLEANALGHLGMVEQLEAGDKAILLASYQRYFAALQDRLKAFSMTVQVPRTPPMVLAAQDAGPLTGLDLRGRLDGLAAPKARPKG